VIVIRRTGAVATIALDRPAARNALSAEGWDALADAVADVAGSSAAAVILRSDVSGIFSAGADLTMLATLIDDAAARPRFRSRMARAIDGLAALPMPVIAAVDAGCYGAAVALTLACDICLAGPDAVFAVTPARLGIGYPGPDIARLMSRVGRGHAARMLYTAAPIDAAEAVRIGLADLRVEDAAASAQDMAELIATNAPSAVRLLKHTVQHPDTAGEPFDAAFGDGAFAERLAAFQRRS